MDKRKRTSISTDQLRAVDPAAHISKPSSMKNPPIPREEPDSERAPESRQSIDVDVILNAWASSASALKDVAKAVRENQEDNEETRAITTENRRMVTRTSWLTGILQVACVTAILWNVTQTSKQIGSFLKDQHALISGLRKDAADVRASMTKVRDEAKTTAEQSKKMSEEAQSLSTAVAAVLELTIAMQQRVQDLDQKKKLLEAEITLAETQATLAPTPVAKAKAQKRAAAVKAKAAEQGLDF